MKLKKLAIYASFTALLAAAGFYLYPQIFRNEIVVAVQPIETSDSSLITNTALAINQYYGFKVEVLPSIRFPGNAFIDLKSPRYRADTIIQYLEDNAPQRYDYIVGITEKDISFTKRNEDGTIKSPVSRYADFGIFGLGFRPGRSSIVSSFRLKCKDHDVYNSRVRKVALHELGHNLGLKHCEIDGCVMNSAKEHMETIDESYESLCSLCKSQLK